VPIAADCRSVMVFGRGTSHSLFTRTFWPSPPQWLSPSPQPLRITSSPGFHAGLALDSTTPDASMPATIGHARTIGERLASASASLKLTVEYSTRTVTSPSGSFASSSSETRAWNASPSFVR
jgi:hypothetical protein